MSRQQYKDAKSFAWMVFAYSCLAIVFAAVGSGFGAFTGTVLLSQNWLWPVVLGALSGLALGGSLRLIQFCVIDFFATTHALAQSQNLSSQDRFINIAIAHLTALIVASPFWMFFGKDPELETSDGALIHSDLATYRQLCQLLGSEVNDRFQRTAPSVDDLENGYLGSEGSVDAESVDELENGYQGHEESVDANKTPNIDVMLTMDRLAFRMS